MKMLLLVLVAVTVVGASGCSSKEAEAAAQEKGYAAGQDAGYKSGYEKGKTDGQSAGKQAGYDEGYKAGGVAVVAAVTPGPGLSLHNPTYAEAAAFLAQDKTDLVPYNDLTYVCTHYARDVINHAVAKGIRIAYVEIRHPGMSHSIIAFETTDKGLMYFEPQHDNEVRPQLNKKLWQCMMPMADGATFSAPDYDDTINDILIIW